MLYHMDKIQVTNEICTKSLINVVVVLDVT